MKYLLDTHVLFWALADEEKLEADILDIINSPDNVIYYSSASIWEITIKHSKHPDNMPVDGRTMVNSCKVAGFLPLAIEEEHVLAVASLKRKSGEKEHNDPFDRILVAQAKTEGMVLITQDSLIPGYDEDCIMKI